MSRRILALHSHLFAPILWLAAPLLLMSAACDAVDEEECLQIKHGMSREEVEERVGETDCYDRSDIDMTLWCSYDSTDGCSSRTDTSCFCGVTYDAKTLKVSEAGWSCPSLSCQNDDD